jgi:hypothetical protein
MEKSDLGDVQGHVLDFGIVWRLRQSNLEESVDSGVSNDPVEGLQNVPLHLREHFVIVKGAAHGLELSYSWYSVLLVTILGSDEQGSTPNKLVVALVDNTAGAVTVEEVDGEEQCFRQQLESGVRFNQEVKEIGPHEPLDLCLDVNRVDIRYCL